MKKENITKPTEAQIKAWKDAYRGVHQLTVGDRVAYLRTPDRKTLSLAMSLMSKNDVLGGSEAILNNCWLGGDEEIKNDDELFMSAISAIGELIKFKEAALVKL